MRKGTAKWHDLTSVRLGEAGGGLLLLFLLSEIFYLVLAWRFPLPRLYATNPPVDFAKLTHYAWGAAAGLLAAYVLLFAALARVLWFDKQGVNGVDVRWIKGGAALFAITLVFLYPIFAIDMLMYAVRTRLWLLYGANPLLTFPAQFQDPWIGLTGEWATTASGYSPLWEMLAVVPGWFTEPHHFAAHLMGLKGIALAAFLGDVWVLDRVLQQVWPRTRGWRLLYFAWNPLVLLELVGNGHNDAVMLFFLLLSLWFFWQEREVAAHASLGLAVLIKLTPVFLWPFLWVWGVVRRPSWRARLWYSAWVGGLVVLTGLPFLVFLWPDPRPWQALRESDFAGRSLQALGILIAMSLHVPHAFTRVQRGLRLVFWVAYGLLLVWAWRGFRRDREAGVRAAGLRLVQAWLVVLSLLLLLFASNWRPWYTTWVLALAALAPLPMWHWGAFALSFTAATGDVFWTFIRWRLRQHLTPLIAHLLGVPWVFGVPLIVGWLGRNRGPSPDDG